MPKKVEIKEDQLKAFLQLQPSLEMTAAFFKCDGKTIENFIRKKFKATFFEFREQNMVHTRKSLIHKALREALKDKPNTAMLIFCLKNLCGWKDKLEHSADETVTPIMFAYDPHSKLNANVQ